MWTGCVDVCSIITNFFAHVRASHICIGSVFVFVFSLIMFSVAVFCSFVIVVRDDDDQEAKETDNGEGFETKMCVFL